MTNEQIASIRSLYAAGAHSLRQLGRMFSVSHKAIARVVGKPALIDAASVREKLSYDRATGEFRWRSGRNAGQLAGRLNNDGYWQIAIQYRLYQAHRLAWLHQTGGWPPSEIDHRNNCRADNRWENLRLASKSENNANRAPQRAIGKGITLHRQTGRWQAKIKVNGKDKYLGLFETPKQAQAAYSAAAREFFGGFARFPDA